jgi:hypothetical protein
LDEISLHVLDIIENSIAANSTLIKVEIDINKRDDIIKIRVEDNGKGIDKELMEMIQSPFYTSKKERKKKVGLGIPLFKMSANNCNGYFRINSEKGKGTSIEVSFQYSHIDRQPIGKLYDLVLTTITTTENADFIYRINNNGKEFIINTKEIKQELGNVPINHPEVINFLKEYVKQGFEEIELSCEIIY